MATLDRSDQIGRAFIALRVGRVDATDSAGRIAAQRDDVADADLVIARDDFIDIGALIPSSGAVPVVIKSLVFPTSSALGKEGVASASTKAHQTS